MTLGVAALSAAVAAEGRPEADRARDADRKPAEVMEFCGVRPGAKVGELMAASGYYTELLARAIGPDGRLYAHNSPFVLKRFAEGPITERLARLEKERKTSGAGEASGAAADGLAPITRLDAEPETPGFPEGELDVVLLIRFYHDFYWQEVDRPAVNEAVLAALKPGGVYCVLDHHAAAGSGDRDVKTLHRVDAELVKKEILAAGFTLDASSDLLANRSDDRTWNIFSNDAARRDQTDRFLFRFTKRGRLPGTFTGKRPR